MATRALLTSFATGTKPAVQQRREQALFEAGALGETHLHVCTLAGDVLGIGAFHLDPGGAAAEGVLWRRRTGGRAVACGDGFAVLTLALPHRSALVADDRYALRPEQVMNRGVRGILAWIRRRGVDPIYPGLDTVTADRRALAHLSFTELADGPTLFQAIVALERTFAATPELLDRLDPGGRIPLRLVAASESTCLAECSPRRQPSPAGDLDLATLTAEVGAGYAEAFGLEVAELDPAVTELLVADDPASDAIPPLPLDEVAPASASGLLGMVSARARVADGRVVAFSLSGNFVAPAWAVRELSARIEGGPASADAVTAAADSVLDGNRGYLLGLAPAALRELLARAVRGDG